MAALPYMQFQIAEYKADTEHLTTAQHGAYLLLLFNYWVTGKPLPDNDRKLAAIARCTPEEWAAMRTTIADYFKIDGGEWCHSRIERDLAKIRDKRDQAVRAGKASAEKQKNARANDRSNARTNHKEKDKDKDKEKEKDPVPSGTGLTLINQGLDHPQGDPAGLPLGLPPPDPVGAVEEKYSAAFEAWWLVYPLKAGKRKAFLAYEAAFKRLGGQKAGTARVHQKLLAAARAFAAVTKSKGTEPRYVCHGATWLSQSRWDDADTVKAMTNPPRDNAPVYAGPELPAAPKPEARVRADG